MNDADGERGSEKGEVSLQVIVVRVGLSGLYRGGQSQYFSSQFSSSRTLILPCQGFCSRE